MQHNQSFIFSISISISISTSLSPSPSLPRRRVVSGAEVPARLAGIAEHRRRGGHFDRAHGHAGVCWGGGVLLALLRFLPSLLSICSYAL
jgi:hypothetical protein